MLIGTTFAFIAAEFLFDWFIMAYINGVLSFARCAKSKDPEESEQWENAYALAKDGHSYLRKGAAYAERFQLEDAEHFANEGVEILEKRFVHILYSLEVC